MKSHFRFSIFEDQQVSKKKKQKLRRLSETEDSLTPAYDENYHDNGAVNNGKFAFKNKGYDKDTDRLSLDSNDPQCQDISKMLPLQSFSSEIGLGQYKGICKCPIICYRNMLNF